LGLGGASPCVVLASHYTPHVAFSAHKSSNACPQNEINMTTSNTEIRISLEGDVTIIPTKIVYLEKVSRVNKCCIFLC